MLQIDFSATACGGPAGYQAPAHSQRFQAVSPGDCTNMLENHIGSPAGS
jgi:hypothetical protein